MSNDIALVQILTQPEIEVDYTDHTNLLNDDNDDRNFVITTWTKVEEERKSKEEKEIKNLWDFSFALARTVRYGADIEENTISIFPEKIITNQGDNETKLSKKLYNVIEYPIFEETLNNVDFELHAANLKKLIDPANLSKNLDQFSFKHKLDFHNLFIYIPEAENIHNLTLPGTAVPIIGTVFSELLTKIKALIITDDMLNGPINSFISDALEQAINDIHNLTENNKKRIILIGVAQKLLGMDYNQFAKLKTPNGRYNNNSAMLDLIDTQVQNAHIILRYVRSIENPKILKEKILFEISKLLKIPALKLNFIVERSDENEDIGKCNKIQITFLDPDYQDYDYSQYFEHEYNFYNKNNNLYKQVLRMANESFYRNPHFNYTGWNLMTPALFLNDKECVQRIFTIVRLEDDSENNDRQIDRIIRYSLFHGSRDIVKDVFNYDPIQKLLVKRREATLTNIFKKSFTELFVFQRLTNALTENPLYVNNKFDVTDTIAASLHIVNYLQIAIGKLLGKGFLWNKPIVPVTDETISKSNYEVFFAEYMMVWSALALRYDICELFLEYSGTFLQEISAEDKDFYRTKKGIYQISNALAISRLLYGISKAFKFETSVSTEEKLKIRIKAAHFENIAVELLDHALSLNEFTTDEIFTTQSPFWNSSNAIQLASDEGDQVFFTHEGVQSHVRNDWRGITKINSKQTSGSNVNISIQFWTSLNNILKCKIHSLDDSLLFLYYYYITPGTTFKIHALFYFLFLVNLTVLVIITWENPICTAKSIPDLIYVVYVFAYILDEVFQYRFLLESKIKGRRVKFKQWGRILKSALSEYIGSAWNILDIIIAIMYVITVTMRSISWYITVSNTIGCDPPATNSTALNLDRAVRALYGLAAVLFYIRFFQYVLVLKGLGPLIYTCYLAFKRMLKFMIILVLITLCFGIIEVSLISPSAASGWQLLRILLFFPYLQIFGEYDLQSIHSMSFTFRSFNNASNMVSNDFSSDFWTSTTVLSYLIIMVLLLIANVLLLNLMIAYFTKIFEKVSENAESIYLTQFLEVVEEYKRKAILPPPFNLIIYSFRFFNVCLRVCADFFHQHSSTHSKFPERDKLFNRAKVYSVYFADHRENGFADAYWTKQEINRTKMNYEEEQEKKSLDKWAESRQIDILA